VSKIDLIEKHLKAGHPITPALAFMRFGSLRLSAVIYDLKNKRGMSIETNLITVGTGDDESRVAEYRVIQ
jgi:hypothetical protein